MQSPEILGLNWLPMLALYSKLGNKEYKNHESVDIGKQLKKLDGNENIIINGINNKLDELIKKNGASIDIKTLKTEIISKLSDKIDSRSNSPVTCTNNSVNIPEEIQKALGEIVDKAITENELSLSLETGLRIMNQNIIASMNDMVGEVETISNAVVSTESVVEKVDSVQKSIDTLLNSPGAIPLPNVIEDTDEVPSTAQPDVDSMIDSFIKRTKYAGYPQDAIDRKTQMMMERIPNQSEISAKAVAIGSIGRSDIKNKKHVEIPNVYPRDVFESIIQKRIESETQFSIETISNEETSKRVKWFMDTLDEINRHIWPEVDGKIYEYPTLVIKISDSFKNLSVVDVVERTETSLIRRITNRV
jgi:hypothetical protein